MGVPVARRTFDAFLSHAHKDQAFVNELYHWLGNVAGFNIWYDAKNLAGGQGIGSGLQNAIEQCRGVILIASPDALSSGWVANEIDIAVVERNDTRDFRIVPLRLRGADVSGFIKGLSWIEVPDGKLTPDVAAQLLRSFYPAAKLPDPRTSRDVYLSISWHSGDNTSALVVEQALIKAGFRLIGDAKDQKGFKTNRIQSIIESCGAFAGVVPYREDTASASANEKPYKYFLTELDIATRANVPALMIADARIHRTDGDDRSWLRMDTNAKACPTDVLHAIDSLWEAWISPPHGHHVFLATDLGSASAQPESDLRRLIERVTGMPTVVGNEIREPDLQPAIMRAIQTAFLVIADISGATEDTFNIDVCIEAGMALSAGANLALVARGKPRTPPFMLRHAGQLTPYSDDVEQLGAIHRIVREYRRRVINAELGPALPAPPVSP
jgi:hypothetical protein